MHGFPSAKKTHDLMSSNRTQHAVKTQSTLKLQNGNAHDMQETFWVKQFQYASTIKMLNKDLLQYALDDH